MKKVIKVLAESGKSDENRIEKLNEKLEKISKELSSTTSKKVNYEALEKMIMESQKKYDEKYSELLSRLKVLENKINTLNSGISSQVKSEIKRDFENVINEILKALQEVENTVSILKQKGKEVDVIKNTERSIKSEFDAKIAGLKSEMSVLSNKMETVFKTLQKIDEELNIVKMMRDELLDDVNAIISSELDNFKKEEKKIEEIDSYINERLDKIEEEMERKLAIIMDKIDRDLESKFEAIASTVKRVEVDEKDEEKVMETLASKLRELEKENALLKFELEKLRKLYGKLIEMKYKSPMVIE